MARDPLNFKINKLFKGGAGRTKDLLGQRRTIVKGVPNNALYAATAVAGLGGLYLADRAGLIDLGQYTGMVPGLNELLGTFGIGFGAPSIDSTKSEGPIVVSAKNVAVVVKPNFVRPSAQITIQGNFTSAAMEPVSVPIGYFYIYKDEGAGRILKGRGILGQNISEFSKTFQLNEYPEGDYKVVVTDYNLDNQPGGAEYNGMANQTPLPPEPTTKTKSPKSAYTQSYAVNDPVSEPWLSVQDRDTDYDEHRMMH